MMEFSNVQNLVEEPYRKLGFYDQWELKKLAGIIDRVDMFVHDGEISDSVRNDLMMLKVDLMVLMDIGEVGLFSEEVGELLDTIRKGERWIVPANDIHKIKSVGEECADLAIRLLNFCNRKKINLEHEILKKNDYNKRRSYLHDKRA